MLITDIRKERYYARWTPLQIHRAPSTHWDIQSHTQNSCIDFVKITAL